MLPEIGEIKVRRLALDLKQTELAAKAGVYQSQIAKLERKPGFIKGSNTERKPVDAAYSVVKRIFDTLEELEAKKKNELKAVSAKTLCYRPVTKVQTTDSVGKAMVRMKDHNYSQLPVYKGNHVVGSISWGAVNKYLIEGKDPKSLQNVPIKDIMEGEFPIVGEETRGEDVISLLSHSPAVLVTKEGRATGIVTNADLFKVVKLKPEPIA